MSSYTSFLSAKVNFDDTSEAELNKLINVELTAAYTCASMACFFAKDKVALPGLEHYFKEAKMERLKVVKAILKYMKVRGGNIKFSPINAPQEWNSTNEIINTAYEIEKHVCNKYLELIRHAHEKHDPQLHDFVQTVLLRRQQENVRELTEMIASLKKTGNDGLGLFVFDRDVAERLKMEPHKKRPDIPEREDFQSEEFESKRFKDIINAVLRP